MATIIIQAGHCHRTRGSIGTQGRDGDPNEQQVVWDVANRATALLRAAGHRAATIKADVPSGSYRGDAFVAVHCDGSTNASVRGASVGYRSDEGRQLAHAFKAAYARRGWRTWRPDNYTAALQGYYGTRRAISVGNRAACIVELGFLTNAIEEAELASDAGRDRAAAAIADAVIAVFGGTTIPTTTEDDSEEDDMFVELILAAYRRVRGKTYEPRTSDADGWTHWMRRLGEANTSGERRQVVAECEALCFHEAVQKAEAAKK